MGISDPEWHVRNVLQVRRDLERAKAEHRARKAAAVEARNRVRLLEADLALSLCSLEDAMRRETEPPEGADNIAGVATKIGAPAEAFRPVTTYAEAAQKPIRASHMSLDADGQLSPSTSRPAPPPVATPDDPSFAIVSGYNGE